MTGESASYAPQDKKFDMNIFSKARTGTAIDPLIGWSEGYTNSLLIQIASSQTEKFVRDIFAERDIIRMYFALQYQYVRYYRQELGL